MEKQTGSSKKDVSTKEKILRQAIQEFLEYGFYGARMQRIADRAKINKAMLFYYYKNKEQIYKAALGSIFKIMLGNFNKISNKPVSIEKKVLQLIDIYTDVFMKYPDYFQLIQYELSRGGKNLKEYNSNNMLLYGSEIKKIYEYFDKKMASGEIKRVDIFQLIISIVGQVMASFVIKPFFEMVGFRETLDFNAFIEKRKKFIIKLVFEGIGLPPKKQGGKR